MGWFTWNDKTRAALISVAQSLFPMLVLLGLVNLTDTQIAGIILFITNTVTFLGLAIKTGQGTATTSTVETTTVEVEKTEPVE
jgi:hypothetical protein